MLSIRTLCRTLTVQQIANRLSLDAMHLTAKRDYFAPSYFGIDKFVRHQAYIANNFKNVSETVRTSIKQTLDNKESKLFTEDLKTFMYMVKNDEDVDLLIKALDKYHSQEASGVYSFNFEAPVMRLLYSLNKTDAALNLYFNNPIFRKSHIASFVLLNKLFAEKKVSDFMRVFNDQLELFNASEKKQTPLGPNGEQRSFGFSADMTHLFCELMMNQNNAEAVGHAKHVLEYFKEKNMLWRSANGRICLFLLGLNQKNSYLMTEACNYTFNNVSLAKNLQAIKLAVEQKPQEAINTIEEILVLPMQGQYGNLKPFVFKFTLDKVQDAVSGANNAELIEMHNKTKDGALSFSFRYDIVDYCSREILMNRAQQRMEREKLMNERNESNNEMGVGFTRENRGYNRNFADNEFSQSNQDRGSYRRYDNSSSGMRRGTGGGYRRNNGGADGFQRDNDSFQRGQEGGFRRGEDAAFQRGEDDGFQRGQGGFQRGAGLRRGGNDQRNQFNQDSFDFENNTEPVRDSLFDDDANENKSGGFKRTNNRSRGGDGFRERQSKFDN